MLEGLFPTPGSPDHASSEVKRQGSRVARGRQRPPAGPDLLGTGMDPRPDPFSSTWGPQRPLDKKRGDLCRGALHRGANAPAHDSQRLIEDFSPHTLLQIHRSCLGAGGGCVVGTSPITTQLPGLRWSEEVATTFQGLAPAHCFPSPPASLLWTLYWSRLITAGITFCACHTFPGTALNPESSRMGGSDNGHLPLKLVSPLDVACI